MGGTTSTPIAPGQAILKDTTLRSVIFGKKDFEVIQSAGSTILKEQVSSDKFREYEHVLRVMSQISRLIYCDSGIIRKVLLEPEFGTFNNSNINTLITNYDREYLNLKKTPTNVAGKSIEFRPMASYTIDLIGNPTEEPIARYISTPSDVTFMFLKGSQLSSKCSFFQPNDVILGFKGSSTVANFKHDFYSVITARELRDNMPPGTTMSSTSSPNTVVGSFLIRLIKAWPQIKKGLELYNPTRLFITGHSLGGAYATLLAFILAETKSLFPGIKSVHLISLGSPTVMRDGARNTFNAHLDSGFLTLDRLASYVFKLSVTDAVPSIPAGMSHPGFQPLRTELYPEKRTGRAYYFDTIRKVYQTGGALAFTKAKGDYNLQTMTHMPNLIKIPVTNPEWVLLPGLVHLEYFDMLWKGSLRTIGMKNPGFKNNTFVEDIYPSGIDFNYETTNGDVSAEEPNSEQSTMTSPKKGGTRRSKLFLKRSRRRKFW
jgi:pimeloyl-ACP methyl ester carboxylesterase